MEKLVLRHDKVPAEVSLINYDDAMQIAPAAGSPECTVQLACHCGGRITHGLCEERLYSVLEFMVTRYLCVLTMNVELEFNLIKTGLLLRHKLTCEVLFWFYPARTNLKLKLNDLRLLQMSLCQTHASLKLLTF